MSDFDLPTSVTEAVEPKKRRGFAAMSKELQRFLSSKGGKSQGKENNPANFAHNPARASSAGRAKGTTVAFHSLLSEGTPDSSSASRRGTLH